MTRYKHSFSGSLVDCLLADGINTTVKNTTPFLAVVNALKFAANIENTASTNEEKISADIRSSRERSKTLVAPFDSLKISRFASCCARKIDNVCSMLFGVEKKKASTTTCTSKINPSAPTVKNKIWMKTNIRAAHLTSYLTNVRNPYQQKTDELTEDQKRSWWEMAASIPQIKIINPRTEISQITKKEEEVQFFLEALPSIERMTSIYKAAQELPNTQRIILSLTNPDGEETKGNYLNTISRRENPLWNSYITFYSMPLYDHSTISISTQCVISDQAFYSICNSILEKINFPRNQRSKGEARAVVHVHCRAGVERSLTALAILVMLQSALYKSQLATAANGEQKHTEEPLTIKSVVEHISTQRLCTKTWNKTTGRDALKPNFRGFLGKHYVNLLATAISGNPSTIPGLEPKFSQPITRTLLADFDTLLAIDNGRPLILENIRACLALDTCFMTHNDLEQLKENYLKLRQHILKKTRGKTDILEENNFSNPPLSAIEKFNLALFSNCSVLKQMTFDKNSVTRAGRENLEACCAELHATYGIIDQTHDSIKTMLELIFAEDITMLEQKENLCHNILTTTHIDEHHYDYGGPKFR